MNRQWRVAVPELPPGEIVVRERDLNVPLGTTELRLREMVLAAAASTVLGEPEELRHG